MSKLFAPEKILEQHWGFTSFRPFQKEIINSILSGNDTLALLPTGGGKSLCYQLPALARDGFCLVISPLIALMNDQVKRLQEQGISAAFLQAGTTPKEVEQILRQAVSGVYKLLYISPERLQTHLFKTFLPEFDLSLIAVDEAHCISQWGHDFRPDYLKISLLKNYFRKVPVLALTATATQEVQDDIVQQLRLRNVQFFKQSFRRDNIFYDIKYSDNKTQDTIETLKAQTDSAIIYCRSRRQTEMLAKHLNERGFPAICYHAGMARNKRNEAQQLWMNDDIKTIVATTAFGMGIDKPDVRTVLHYDVPEHPEAYYQEAGRAGRDGKPSWAVCLFNQSDIAKLKESPANHFPPEVFLRKVYQNICEYLQIPISAQPDKYYDFNLSEFCKNFQLPVLKTTQALRLLQQEDLWTISDAVFHPPTVYFKTDRSIIDQLPRTDPALALTATSLLRLYGSLFYYPTPVRIAAIAKLAKLKQSAVQQNLEHLSRMNIIEYNAPKDGAQLYFHHTRADSRHLLIDLQRIHTLRKKFEIRVQAMLNFLDQQHVCRERFLLNYFGENDTNDCGHCDVCRKKQANHFSKNEMKEQLLSQMQKPYSLDEILHLFPSEKKDVLIEVLRELSDEGKIIRDVKGLFSLKI